MVAAYTQYISSFSPVGTTAHVNECRGLINRRLANCPRTRGRIRYFQLDATNGNASGGGRDGLTEATAYLVRHASDAFTLMTSIIGAGDIRFSFKGDDVFYCTSRFDLTVANVTIGCHGTGRAIFTSFKLETEHQAGAWTQSDGNRWSKTFTGMTDMTWVRGIGALSAIRNGAETALKRVNFTTDLATTLALVRDNANSFYIETSGGNNIVHVNIGGNPGGNVMISRSANHNGIQVVQVDGCRIEGIEFIGVTITDANNSYAPLVGDITGTMEVVFANCNVFYGGSAHSTLTVNSQSGAGGIVTWYNCKCGYMMNPSNDTDGSMMTAYNANGGQEMYIVNCEATYGTLPYHGKNLRRGNPFYCHSSGVPRVALALVMGFTTKNHVHGLRTNGFMGTTPDYTGNHLNTASYRCWIYDETFEGGDGTRPTIDDTNVLRINGKLKFRPSAIADGSRPSDGFFTNTYHSRKAAYINTLWEFDLTNQVDGVNAVCMFVPASVNNQEPMTWLHCHFRFFGHSGTCNFAWHVVQGDATAMEITNKRMFNTVYTVDNNAAAVRQQVCNNAAAGLELSDTPTSGYRHCAHFSSATIQKANSGSAGTLRLGYDQGTNFRDNATSPALSVSPTPLAEPVAGLLNQGGSMPIAVEFDINYRQRPATPSIGTNELNSQPLVSLINIEDAALVLPSGAPAGRPSRGPRRVDRTVTIGTGRHADGLRTNRNMHRKTRQRSRI